MDQLTEFVIHNWVLFLALVIILFMLARTWITPGGIKNIGPMEAVSLSNHKNGVFIDVRTDDEYREGHILHSLHAPLGLLDSKLKEINKYQNRPLIVYCRSGSRSARAGGLLKKQGFAEVYNLAGGVMAWQNANLPLTKDKSPPPGDGGSGTPAAAKDKKTNDSSNAESAVAATDSGSNLTNRQAQDQSGVVYITQRCPFCVQALNLLSSKGVGVQKIDIDDSPGLRDEMERKTQRKTVPQIFIGDYHVGGCDDIYDLERKGRLDPLLGLK